MEIFRTIKNVLGLLYVLHELKLNNLNSYVKNKEKLEIFYVSIILRHFTTPYSMASVSNPGILTLTLIIYLLVKS